MRLVVWAVKVLAVPASTKRLASNTKIHRTKETIRGECDGCADAAPALLLGQVECVLASARCSSEWILLLVGEAAVAKLLLLASFCAKRWVTNDHAETLSIELATSWPS